MGYFDKNLIGVDIGSYSDKVVSLSGASGSYTLRGAEAVRRTGAPATGSPAPSVDAPIVAGMMSSIGVKPGRGAAVISMDHVTFRQLELPDMPEPDMQKAVRWELKKESALPEATAVCDFISVGKPDKAEARDKVSLIAFAAARTDIDPLIATAKGASIDLRSIEVVPTALLAAFDMAYDWEVGVNYAVVDMGATMSTLVILKDRRVVFIRRINFGGAPITSSLSTGLGIDLEAAEGYLSGYGLKEAGTETIAGHGLVTEQTDRLVSELRRSIDYYHAQFRAGKVSSVYLAGGPALIPGLPEYLTDSLGMDTFVMDPFRRVKLGRGVDAAAIGAVAPMVAVAAGLATRRG